MRRAVFTCYWLLVAVAVNLTIWRVVAFYGPVTMVSIGAILTPLITDALMPVWLRKWAKA